jgi:hypothetical protein
MENLIISRCKGRMFGAKVRRKKSQSCPFEMKANVRKSKKGKKGKKKDEDDE